MTVSGCISAFCGEKLVKINGTLTKGEVQADTAAPCISSWKSFNRKRINFFQQNNIPNHTSNIVKQYLENKVTADVLPMC